jgi:hypothetical protein
MTLLQRRVASRCGGFSQTISSAAMCVIGAFLRSSIDFLDTFDMFDKSRAALPRTFLQLPLLSFMSVLECELPLQKSAIA